MIKIWVMGYFLTDLFVYLLVCFVCLFVCLFVLLFFQTNSFKVQDVTDKQNVISIAGASQILIR